MTTKNKRKAKYPTKKEMFELIRDLKPTIGDDYVSMNWDPSDEGGPPLMTVTVGLDPKDGSWGYQTGDNSYTGGAYGYHYWAVVDIHRRSNSNEVAQEILDQWGEMLWDWEGEEE